MCCPLPRCSPVFLSLVCLVSPWLWPSVYPAFHHVNVQCSFHLDYTPHIHSLASFTSFKEFHWLDACVSPCLVIGLQLDCPSWAKRKCQIQIIVEGHVVRAILNLVVSLPVLECSFLILTISFFRFF